MNRKELNKCLTHGNNKFEVLLSVEIIMVLRFLVKLSDIIRIHICHQFIHKIIVA